MPRESEIKTEHLDIEELIFETIKLAQNKIKFKKVKVETAFPDNMPLIHGGDIRAESEVGVGTVFYVSFPIAKIPAALEK